MIFALIVVGLLVVAGIVLYVPRAKIDSIYKKIQPNMSYAEVTNILGSGTQIRHQSGMRTLTWKYPILIGNFRVGKTKVINITFKDDVVLESELIIPEEIDM